MAASAKVDTLATDHLPPRNSLMGLPVELRLDIIERVLNEDHLHLLEKSATGETIYQIWYRFFLSLGRFYFKTTQTFHMVRWGQWSFIQNFDHPAIPQDLHTYRLHVHPLLHTNYILREEGRDVYLKFAKRQMAAYEAKQKSMLPLFIDGLQAYKQARASGGQARRSIGYGADYEEGFELAETCIRWYALKKTCELLERHGSCRGSAVVRWRSRAWNGVLKFRSFVDWEGWAAPWEVLDYYLQPC